MKKLLVLIISIIISFSIINPSNAWNLESKLYRSVIVSKAKISKDYEKWDLYNEKISKIFIKYRYYKDKATLNKLEVLLKEKIIALNNKTILSAAERKKLNLYNNLYYRTKLLLDYNLK